MFISELFESRATKVLVTYPGRFQPFHQGHKDVYENLELIEDEIYEDDAQQDALSFEDEDY